MSFTWPIDRTFLPALPALGDAPTPEEQAAYDLALAQQASAEDLAVRTIWALSGRQFGLYETTVRPRAHRPPWWEHYRPWAAVAAWDGATWRDFPCGCAGGACTVTGPSVVHLPGPVAPSTTAAPITVTIEGVEIDPDSYTVEGEALYRRGGVPWPRQDLSRPLGEQNTWSVTYQRGTPPPPETAILVGLLAKEFLAACSGSKCRLPKTVVSTTQHGVTHTFDPTRILTAGKTGIPEIDQWLAAVNPNRLMAAPVVL